MSLEPHPQSPKYHALLAFAALALAGLICLRFSKP